MLVVINEFMIAYFATNIFGVLSLEWHLDTFRHVGFSNFEANNLKFETTSHPGVYMKPLRILDQ